MGEGEVNNESLIFAKGRWIEEISCFSCQKQVWAKGRKLSYDPEWTFLPLMR